MWTAIIAGSGLGVGAIAALIFAIKAARAEGRATTAEARFAAAKAAETALQTELLHANDAKIILVQAQKDDLARRDTVIKSYEERVEKLNDLLSKSTVPAVVIARVGQLFPVPKKDDNG